MPTASPDQRADPWGWAQWARQQDPGTYDLGTVDLGSAEAAGVLQDPQQRAFLQQQGLWRPEFDAYAGSQWQETATDGGGNGAEYVAPPDMSALQGYRMRYTQGPNLTMYGELIGPDGQPAGVNAMQQSHGSMTGRDWLTAATVVGGGALAGYGLAANGIGAGATAAGGAAASGGAPIWNAALAESAAGTAGYGASSAGLGGGAGVLSGATAFPVAEGAVTTTALPAGGGTGVLPGAAPGSAALTPQAALQGAGQATLTSGVPGALPASAELAGGTNLLSSQAVRTGGGLLASAATGGGGGGGGGGGSDPISDYLRTGASEGSTVGNGITGAGGAAGAVGQGTAAGYLGGLTSLFSSGTASSFQNGLQQYGLGQLLGGGQLGRDLLGMLGAGMNQVNLERMARDNREFQSSERQKDRDFQTQTEANKRRRQAPVGVARGPGVLAGAARVIPGG